MSPLSFSSLDLPGPVRRGIEDAGFVATTAIQEAALPLALRGKDVAGQSQTGTGKTAAFLIAAFTRCLTHPAPARSGATAPRVLIIAPTRELVVQIEADARLLGAHTGLRILSVYGGIDYNKQREDLREGCDVLVGTPGRLIDYLKQHVWSPARVEVLVIDEADRMFDMGFIADLRFILRRLPKPEKRQSFLFSATLSFRVMELTWEFMNNPVQISITPQQKTVEKAEQVLYHVGREEKFNLLLGLLRREGGSRILIFSNTREEARRLEDRLGRNGWQARALTGDVDQKKRLKILNDFKDGQLPILVATDVASRGLHIEGVSHVVNWDMPQDAEDYVHRIGRTARAGAAGKAISLVDEAGALALEPIEKFISQKIHVDWAEDELYLPEIKPTSEERRRYAEEKRARMAARGGSGGRGGGPGRPGGGGGGGRRDGAPPAAARAASPRRARIDLRLPDPERRLAATLGPGGATSSTRPVPASPPRSIPAPTARASWSSRPHGPAVRVSSLVVPAFGGDLCRLRLETLERAPSESFGSFFEVTRTGRVYALTPDRSAGAARAPERAEWRYEGPALASRLGRITGLRLLRERVRGGDFSWQADRGLVLTDAAGGECLAAERGRAVGDRALPAVARSVPRRPRRGRSRHPPGSRVRDLLGYGAWPDDLDVTVELLPSVTFW